WRQGRCFLPAPLRTAFRKQRRREGGRGPVREAAVRSAMIVELTPPRRVAAGIGQGPEEIGVQAFITDAALESFHHAVLLRLARLRRHRSNFCLFTPGQKVPTAELRSIAHAEGGSGVAARPSDGPERA